MNQKYGQYNKYGTHITFRGNTDEEMGWGVKGMHDCVVYKATFVRDTAERIAELLNSDAPPRDWNVMQEILIAEGFSVSDVTPHTVNAEVSPDRASRLAATVAADTDTYVIYRGETDEYCGYGVKGILGGVVYEANFIRDTAERIAELLNSPNPPVDYEATAPILQAEGFSIEAVKRVTANKEVSPGRAGCPLSSVRIATNGNLTLGSYQVSASLDEDGHLTVVIGSLDNSSVIELDTEVGCRDDDEKGFRFSTQAIERAYNESSTTA